MRVSTRYIVKQFTSILAVATAIALFPLAAPPASAADTVSRSAGPERIATAVAASRDHRAAADDALLATATSFPDALSAGALAAGLEAPLLLTHEDSLPDSVAAELERLGVSTVWILGGTAVISPAVESDIASRGYEVRRISGEGRYDTAREIALAAGPAETGEVVVALGAHPTPERAWPDAVASGALAASPDRLPTLLTAHDSLPAATERALGELETQRVLLIGGTAAIEPAVEQHIRDLGYEVQRIAGTSRYETSVELADEALRRGNGGEQTVVFATGGNFPDALAAGALAGSHHSPLVLVPPEDLAGSVDAWLRAHTERWAGGVLVGGPVAASDFVVEQLAAAVNDTPAPARPEPEPEPEPEPAAAQEEQDSEQVVGVFEGEGSWYGPGFHGRSTASGETFDRNALTAAHRSLPFGTRVRVTNLNNGRQVIVRINDRGPYHGGRVIDLAEAAARHIDMTSTGTAPVRGEILAD
jgi:putative cell wall-binding protein